MGKDLAQIVTIKVVFSLIQKEIKGNFLIQTNLSMEKVTTKNHKNLFIKQNP